MKALAILAVAVPLACGQGSLGPGNQNGENVNFTDAFEPEPEGCPLFSDFSSDDTTVCAGMRPANFTNNQCWFPFFMARMENCGTAFRFGVHDYNRRIRGASADSLVGLFDGVALQQGAPGYDEIAHSSIFTGLEVGDATSLQRFAANSEWLPLQAESWDVSRVTNMREAFANSTFSGRLDAWDVAAVTDFTGMFRHNTRMATNVGLWNISDGATIDGMLDGACFSESVAIRTFCDLQRRNVNHTLLESIRYLAPGSLTDCTEQMDLSYNCNHTTPGPAGYRAPASDTDHWGEWGQYVVYAAGVVVIYGGIAYKAGEFRFWRWKQALFPAGSMQTLL